MFLFRFFEYSTLKRVNLYILTKALQKHNTANSDFIIFTILFDIPQYSLIYEVCQQWHIRTQSFAI